MSYVKGGQVRWHPVSARQMEFFGETPGAVNVRVSFGRGRAERCTTDT
jgi:hypothetical protein